MGSSLDENIKDELKKKREGIVKKYFLPNSFRFKDENDIDENFLKIFIDVQKNWISYYDAIKNYTKNITLLDLVESEKNKNGNDYNI